MIQLIENRVVLVTTTPQKLMDIANCLKHQEERHAMYAAGLAIPNGTVIESLDTIHTQLHDGDITVMFRLPNHNKEL